ncbi:hypothetical protein K8R62_01745 [bacterium]|nr:hypothetical protein [bacterium]
MPEDNKLEEELIFSQKINTKRIIDDLIKNFSTKEKNVIKRRFGLDRVKRETLEQVGQAHGLTRERIRQIEKVLVGKINEAKELQVELKQLQETVFLILGEHGGVAEKQHLFGLLDKVSELGLKVNDEEKRSIIQENHFDFLLSRIFNDSLEEIKRSDKFKDSYKFKNDSLDHFEYLSQEFNEEIQKLNNIINISELVELILKLENYKKHEGKFRSSERVHSYNWLGDDLSEEERGIFKNYSALYSFLQIIRDLEKNKFGHWGHVSWNEISPKTVNDKIYLVLKNYGKPLHFTEIAKLINDTNFDHKKTNSATVHNELILDDKYVLIGRGMYGLKEWGFKQGTVTQVIKDILESSSEPLNKEDVVKKVLESRMVKESTINLALSNRKNFQKIGDKYAVTEK